MSIQSTFVDGVLTIWISERFDFSAYGEFRATYENLKEIPDRFVVDFLDATYLDSSALGMLLLLRDFGSSDAAPVELINCNPEVRKLLVLSNLNRLFDIR